MQQLMQHPGGLPTNARHKISYPCGVLSGIRSSHFENSSENISSFDSWETRGELLAALLALGYFQPMSAIIGMGVYSSLSRDGTAGSISSVLQADAAAAAE